MVEVVLGAEKVRMGLWVGVIVRDWRFWIFGEVPMMLGGRRLGDLPRSEVLDLLE